MPRHSPEQDGFGIEVSRESIQIVDFRSREEMPRDVGGIRLRPDVFEIDADVGVGGDGDEGKIG